MSSAFAPAGEILLSLSQQNGHASPHPAASCGHGQSHDRDAAPAEDALISARGLWLRRGGRDIVAGVDLDVRRGEIVTLIGPNGAGKTTLVRLVLGIEKPDSGLIVRPASTRIGYVPQRFEVDAAIPMTVQGFLGLGGSASTKEMGSALDEVGARRIEHQQLSKLSGGETQRVLIARALLRQPNLLILDEPASGVDFAGEAELYELVEKLRDERDLGVLLVSHDLHVVMAKSDRVICLNGHVCCSGEPEHVSQHTEYARIFGQQGAAALSVYRHHHDHAHDLTGEPKPLGADDTHGRGS
ncbi:ABC transporter [Hyphomicrobium denitrificans 1NES1]|uniref:ABC transporter n=1 Tax=Hyphomicrobium denitrificans 1NES1 TaxID=670307 RepID=N0BFH0_9HYPH|nr:ABC transporter [Hyphomicrobium denitrificans 1NES1]